MRVQTRVNQKKRVKTLILLLRDPAAPTLGSLTLCKSCVHIGPKIGRNIMKGALFLIVMAMLTLDGSGAKAQQIDYQCLGDCQAAGYMLRFCQAKCSYGEDPAQSLIPQMPAPPPRIDYNCQSNCIAKGYRLQFCQEQCSY